MDNLKIYCMCLDNNYLKIVKKLSYVPVGLKNNNFSKECILDNSLVNIYKKNIKFNYRLLDFYKESNVDK